MRAHWVRATVAFVTVAACALIGPFDAPSAARRPKRTDVQWDQRIVKYAKFVERERKLRFKHPVTVRFLPAKKFKKLLRGSSKPTKADKEFEQQSEGELLALGLVDEGIDFGKSSDELEVEGTVGFYDPATQKFFVRGNLHSVNARVTVVHELTHALQDQHFDLKALHRTAKEGSQSYALDFLIEGDATFVEDAYIDGLSKKERDRYFGEVKDFVDKEHVSSETPYALDVFLSAPYALGPGFMYALDPSGGTKGRNREFHHPPKTEEVLIDPVALHQRQPAKKVPAPKVERGEKKLYGPEQFGVVTLYLMFGPRLDVRTALEAVTGWGGDQYIGFKKNGHACVRINVTGDTRTDTNQYEDAFRQWQGTMPAGAVEVERAGQLITVTACETRGEKAPSRARFDRAFYAVLSQRIFFILHLVDQGLGLRDARCVADLVSTDPAVIDTIETAAEDNREPTSEDFRILDRAYLEAFPQCGIEPPS